jgi:hypothetical protein
MAEAQLLSQKAAVQEAANLSKFIALQQKELEMKQDEARIMREDRKEELKLNFEEHRSTSAVLQKNVERLCPEEDPTERYTARKRKLDDSRAVLGEELYQARVNQLKKDFLNTATM